VKEKLKKEIISIIKGVLEGGALEENSEVDIDSLKLMEIVVILEKKYKIRINEKYLPKLTSLEDIIRVVEELLRKNKIK
jgi:acyl carrier protein